MAERDLLIAWLNDAYGMENSLIEVLEHQANDSSEQQHPLLAGKLREHLEQTRRHAELVKGCVESLGGSTSALKSGMSTLMGKVQSLSTGAAQDEVVKDCLQDYAAESFEVASYTALIAAADNLGEAQVSSVCQEILTEDRAMQQWIEQNLPMVIRETMNTVAGASA